MAKKKKPDRVPGTVSYQPSRRWTEADQVADGLLEMMRRLPPGLFAILCNENSRYTAFWGATNSLLVPMDSRFSITTGAYVVDSHNRAVAAMLPHEDWIMFMGDDHVFPPELILKLLALMYRDDLDIIAPVCFKRSFPPTVVLFKDPNEDGTLPPINLDDYPNGGLIEVYAAGSAGMIVRRRVLDAIEPPWFRLGVGGWGEDVDFCRRAREAGFKVWADLDMSLGHILNTALWPVRSEKGGEWGCQYDFNTQGGLVLALSEHKEAVVPAIMPPFMDEGEG